MNIANWEAAKVTDLDISTGLARTLEAAGMAEIGQVIVWLESGKQLSQIQGMGPEDSSGVGILRQLIVTGKQYS